ncbi:glycoside hydrolase family 5 protein [Aquimarina agarilytica]|uniref:glycoside hydrolase family 5 protein n=1 Tax=Aquimarina agarilytica TaxID=1087449 RepID=UPI00028984C9|nr:cellulase family glycosylhydrolase [Aquimarina agarilytica]
MKPIIILLLFIYSISYSQQLKTNTANKFEVKKGTNIAHWLSQSGRRGKKRALFFTESDIAKIATMGFDHIRLPIDEEQMWDKNGKQYNDAFQLMINCINWCATYNLKVIVDLHILRSHHFNAAVKPLWTDKQEQEKFFNLWIQLSEKLKQFPTNLVAYELMNEAVADDNESWNQLIASAFSRLREIEPKRTIVIGSNQWQSVHTFNDLKVPPNDSNILLSFHFYEPFLLTHYHTNWTELKNYMGPVHYPGVILTEKEFNKLPEKVKTVVKKWVGKEFNKAHILKMWQQPIEKAKALGLPLYCGEFGIITQAPQNDRLKWYKDVVQLFKENNIGYANWNYNSDEFGLIDNKILNKELIQIISDRKQ